MKRIALAAIFVAALSACAGTDVVSPSQKEMTPPGETRNGFDIYGYNDVANIFVGTADGVDRNLDGLSWGVDTPYDDDHLVMKWNRAWELCNADRTVANCTGAWLSNEWNGMGAGGSNETWHYIFKWVGNCVATPSLVPEGGYCIWNEYAVVLSQGTAGGHFWDARATPVGLGIK